MTTSHVERYTSAPRWQLLREVVTAAALTHDVGKVNQFFAAKLRRKNPQSDPWRHEYLSAHLLARMNEPQTGGWSQAGMERAWEALRADTRTVKRFPFKRDRRSVYALVQWLALTHHRLPKTENGGKLCSQTYQSRAKTKDIAKCLTPVKQWTRLFSDADYANALAQAYGVIQSREGDAKLAVRLFDALFAWGRLALMLGDQHASSRLIEDGVSGVYANSANTRRPAQDLARHLLAVTGDAQQAVELISGAGLAQHLPALGAASMEKLRRGVPDDVLMQRRFGWQDQAEAALVRAADADPDFRQCGFFAVLAADTGSGKTRAAARVLSTVAGSGLRLSTVLGLRTLTLQTRDAYCRELGIDAAEVGLLVGSSEIRALHEARQGPHGEDGDALEDIQVSLHAEAGAPPGNEAGADALSGLLLQQCRSGGENEIDPDKYKLLTQPVLISTIDYLINAGDWRRTRHLLPTLRVMSADLIIDEIDLYSLEDLLPVGRLVYTAGLFGRRVLLSSATAMPEITKPLYAAYRAGWSSYAALSGRPNAVYAGLFSDKVEADIKRH